MALEDVFTNGGGGYDAFTAGQNEAIAQQSKQAKLASELEANRQSVAMNPLLVNQQRLANQTTEAQLPGVVGNSQTLASKGQVDAAGTQDRIKLQAAKAFGDMNEEQLAQVRRQGNTLGALAPKWNMIPPAARPAVLKQFGFSDEDAATFSKLDGQNLMAFGDATAYADPKHIQKMREEQQKEQEAFRRQKYASDRTYDGVVYSTDGRLQSASMRFANPKDETRWNVLNGIPPDQRTPEEQGEFERLTDMRLTQKTANANQVGSELITGKTPTTQSGRTGEAVQRIAQPKAAPAPQPQGMPDGSKQIGTSGGKAVYQAPNGKKYIVE